MKKLSAVICSVLVAVLAFGMVACSSYSSLQKAFEKEGYEVSEDVEEIASSFYRAISEDAEKDGIAIKFHALTKEDGLSSDAVIILEFNATEDLKNMYKDSEELQDAVEDITSDEDVQEAYKKLEEEGYVNGNCFVVSINPLNMSKVKEIVKKA